MNKTTFAKKFKHIWKSFSSDAFDADFREVMKTIPPRGLKTLIWGVGTLAEALCRQANGRFRV